MKGLRLVANGYMSKGGGRYIYGQAPDFIVTPPDANGVYGLQALTADAYILGAEWQVAPKTLLSAYYSGIYIGAKTAVQANGTLVGYGYVGSANSNNKNIKEFTLDATQTIWKDPSYGALQVIGQFSNATRDPWYVAPGTPSSASVNMFFLDLRYVLP
jgi:hypothetical protein